MLTIKNVNKMHNYRWETQQGDMKYLYYTEITPNLKSCYEIRITKRTDEVNGIPRSLLMQIVRRESAKGYYSINMFERGEPVRFTQKKGDEITMECIKGMIESL